MVQTAAPYLSIEPASILEAVPLPLLVISSEGRIVEAGPCVKEVFGYEPMDLVGRSFHEIVHPADRNGRISPFGSGSRRPETNPVQLRLLHRNQLWRHVQVSWRPLSGGAGTVAVLSDVTEARQAEMEWRLLSGVFENALDGMALFDANGCTRHVNRAYAAMLGYEPEEMAGMSWERMVHADDRDRTIDAYVKMMTEGRVIMEARAVRKDGSVFHREMVMIPAHDAGGAFLGHHSFMRDISQRIASEELLRTSRQQLRKLTAHLLRVREDEGSRIAREIHDNLGQNLTGLKLDLAALAARFASAVPARLKSQFTRKTNAVVRLVDEIIESVRRIATELRPGVLDHLGLAAAVEWQAGEFARRSGIRCQVKNSGLDREVGQRETTVAFRIFQELLTNVARHAKATRVDVEIRRTADQVVLTVRDNGRGITAAEISQPDSLGLLGMNERAMSLSGSLHLRGTPGAGTVATLSIPCRPPARGEERG